MKSNLVRILTLAALATSFSNLAMAKESKQDANASVTTQQNDCNGKKGKKQKSANPEENQNKEFDHSLLGIYG